jgi:eukaryotic-like serine/threonine-protein kinase
MTQIGRYEIVRKTGNHGLDTLYAAFDPVMNRHVTIRIAEAQESRSEAGVALDETQGQYAHLDHPNILKILSKEEDNQRSYLVLEQYEGTPLSQLLERESGIERAKLIQILRGAAAALDHAHSKGLVHGTLTSDSLLVTEEGNVKVAGLEAASLAGQLQWHFVDRENLAHRVRYLSPETITGDGGDGRSDQFSLAIVSFQALTGSLPFAGSSPLQVLRSIAFEPAELSMLETRSNASGVARVFERAFSKTPTARYSSCAEFAQAVESGLIGRPSAATRVAAPIPSALEPQLRRGPSPQLLVALIVSALAAIVLLFFALRPTTHPRIATPKAGNPAPAPGPAKQSQPVVVSPPVTPTPNSGASAKSSKPPSGPRPVKKKEAAQKTEPADVQPEPPALQPVLPPVKR